MDNELAKHMIVTSMSRWIQDEMMDGLVNGENDAREWNVVRDYGFGIPLDPKDISGWWMPAAHAARVIRSVGGLVLTAPGPLWLDRVDTKLTGREVLTRRLGEVLDNPWSGAVWTKPAEAKVDEFEARPWSYDEVVALSQDMGLPAEMFIQQNFRVMNLDHEHRFYMLDGKPITGSPYLDGGVVWNDGLGWNNYDEALDFAWDAGVAIDDNQPKAYVLDVGYDKDTSRWVVIEGNPAWCSGFYGSHIPAVADTIEKSMSDGDGPRWAWEPDPYLVNMANAKRELALEFRK